MLLSVFLVDLQVMLVTEMASSLKVLGPVLVLLCPLWGQIINGQNLSRKEFMKQHHLRTTLEFSQYKCDVLMREIEALKDKDSHIFLYASWHQIEIVCFKTWQQRYRNVYVWSQQPFKVLECKKNKFTYNYKEKRSYSYIEFHCSMKAYVDSIEDMRVLEFIHI
ncbi:PREDICTED: epididymal secretory protein E3-beta [Chrysochloris asiatica]|uniref:Epididymal secretory protein E3-beta n=1 Tax=Chrysochloris asiatica TaxID=185453 RepID=A0A9B0WH51_CHRAS|nr:PREDICTED: epididymal secretory protein E3-beta [Chrysochloris asiatica]